MASELHGSPKFSMTREQYVMFIIKSFGPFFESHEEYRSGVLGELSLLQYLEMEVGERGTMLTE